MQIIKKFQWLIFGFMLSTVVAWACPGGCHHNMGGMKGQGGMCQTKACNSDGKGMMCNKGEGMKKMCHTKQSCGHGHKGKKGKFLRDLKYTLKNLNLSTSAWGDVKIAIRSYKADMRKLYIATPLQSIQNGKFDRKLFLSSHPMQKKLEAQADLLETVLLILDDKQKENFAMLMGASQYYNQLHPNKGMGCNACPTGDIKLKMKPLKP